MPSNTMRLHEPGKTHPCVDDAEQWKTRCARRILELDQGLDPRAAMHCVDDMAASALWRRMRPEEAAEALYQTP